MLSHQMTQMPLVMNNERYFPIPDLCDGTAGVYVNADAVPQAEPAADVVPVNEPDAAEEATVIDNAIVAHEMRKLTLGRTPSQVQWKNTT